MPASLSLSLLLSLTALSSPAQAFEYREATFGPVQWIDNTLYPDLVPSTLNADDIAAFDDAVDLWNDAGVVQHFTAVRGDNSYGVGNFDSEVARVCDDFLTLGYTGASWLVFESITGVIFEADIYVNDCHPYEIDKDETDAELQAYGGNTVALTPLFARLLGESIGLATEEDVYSLMNDEQSVVAHDGLRAQWQLGADTTLGARALYGAKTAYDASITHHKRARVGAGHAPTVVTDAEGRPRPDRAESGPPRYAVWAGADIGAEFTIEGIGVEGGLAEITLYWSTDTTLSADDTVLGSVHIPVLPGQVSTYAFPATVPAEAPPGDAAIIVDMDPLFRDSRSDNDRSWLQVEVLHPSEPCTPSQPCAALEGDCDSDSDCEDGLSCVHNVGADYGASRLTDICLPSLWNRCTPEMPCASGEGDCDSDSDCLSGECLHDVGPHYGYSSASLDVCE